MPFLFYLFIFFFGLCIGSFLNVVIFRLETGEGIIKSRSHCPKCGQTLRWYDLIPLASFFILRGRCRYCAKSISWQYPLVEITTGSMFLLVFWNLEFGHWDFIGNWKLEIGNLFTACYMLYVICSLIVIFVYDLRHYIIPDKIIYPAIGTALLFNFYRVLNFGNWDLFGIWNLGFGIWRPFFYPLLSAFAAATFFLALVLITRGRGMGLGDVKLAFLMGLVLGWPSILLALLLAFASGALVGLTLIFFKKKTLKSQIPFGPFLVAATVFTLFLGDKIINWYSQLLL
jgi:prepilin signal peptidase PulO-like enzyme (type II secretory pathway)